MPPKAISSKKAETFKNRYVRLPTEDSLKRLPESLKTLWTERKFKEFLKEALAQLHRKDDINKNAWKDKKAKKLADVLLDILPSLASSQDQGVHSLIQEFYYKYEYLDCKTYADSRYEYNLNFLGSPSSILSPEDWLEEVCPDHAELLEEEENCRKSRLAMKRELLKPFECNEHNIQERTLKVEESLATFWTSRVQAQERHTYTLLGITLEFMERFETHSQLQSEFPKWPGIYCIYFIASRELYPRSQLFGSTGCPVYVGMSIDDISKRLASHKWKIGKAKDLDVSEFSVNFVLLDIKHYAPCIEGMLIEHFNPVWNHETVGLCFGGGENASNLWNIYHVQQDPSAITDVLAKLQIS